ncbi:MAG: hypothetical protein KKC03_14085, partial [Bacteroidetes bacterium]|nr:hypothetical protein [Bacteroidota bacterium]
MRITVRQGLYADLPTLSSGEFGLCTNTDQLYLGTGSGNLQIVLSAGAIDHGGLAGLADDDHSQYHNNIRGDARYYTETELNAGQLDTRYFTETEHINISAGAGDAGKPIKLNATGHVDGTMVSAGAVDHGSLAGLADNDHPQYFMPVGVIMAWLGGYFADGSNGTYTRV